MTTYATRFIRAADLQAGMEAFDGVAYTPIAEVRRDGERAEIALRFRGSSWVVRNVHALDSDVIVREPVEGSAEG